MMQVLVRDTAHYVQDASERYEHPLWLHRPVQELGGFEGVACGTVIFAHTDPSKLRV